MKKIMSVLFVSVVLCLAAACGDTTTTIDGSVPVSVDGPVNMLDIGTCTNNAQCVIDEVCEEVDDFESSQGKTVPVSMCVFGCEAELKTTVKTNLDGTSVTVISKIEGSDTCQRDGNFGFTCDMNAKSDTFRQCIMNEAKPEPAKPDAVEPEVPATEPDTEIVCYFVGDTAGLYGQFGWSEATAENLDAWGAARDREITAMGEFSAMVIYGNVFGGVFYSDMTDGVHTGVAEQDAELEWVGWQFAMPDCTIGGVQATVGPFMQGKGWPFWLDEE